MIIKGQSVRSNLTLYKCFMYYSLIIQPFRPGYCTQIKMDFDNCSNKAYIKFVDEKFIVIPTGILIKSFGSSPQDLRHVRILGNFKKFILLHGIENGKSKYFALGELDPLTTVDDFKTNVKQEYPAIQRLQDDETYTYYDSATGFTYGPCNSNPKNFIRKVVHDWAHDIIGTNSPDWSSHVQYIREHPWED